MNSTLGRVVYVIAQYLNGEKVVPVFKELEHTQWYAPEILINLQWNKIKHLIDHSYKNVPFYTQRFRQHGITPDDIKVIEDCVGKEAKKNFLPMQAGDMLETYADIDDLNKDIGYSPSTNIETGIARFVEWYKKYYGVN